MSCDEVRSHLPEALTGTIEVETRGAVEAHLARCEACRNRADEIARVVALVRSSARSTGDEPSVPRFEDVLATVRAPRRRARLRAARAAGFFLAALCGAAADRALTRTRAPDVPPVKAPEGVRTEARAALAGRPGGLGASLGVLHALSRSARSPAAPPSREPR